MTNGLIGLIFCASGPVAVILAAGSAGNLSAAELSSWIFGVFVLNGILTVIASWVYRMALALAWTIPGTVLVGASLRRLSWAEVLGAFLIAGILILARGLTRRVHAVMSLLPSPIGMGMVAGVFLQFGVVAVIATGEFAPRDSGVVSLPHRSSRCRSSVLAQCWNSSCHSRLRSSWCRTVRAWPCCDPPGIAPGERGDDRLRGVVGRGIVDRGDLIVSRRTDECAAGVLGGTATPVHHRNHLWRVGSDRRRAGARLRRTDADDAGRVHRVHWRLDIARCAAERIPCGAFACRFTLGALVTFLVSISDLSILNIGSAFWGLLAGLAVSWAVERNDFGDPADDQR